MEKKGKHVVVRKDKIKKRKKGKERYKSKTSS
jgi:hypothetical protein